VRTRIVKWGNSLGLRIPKTFAQEVEVRDGSEVDLSVDDGRLVVRPIEGTIELGSLLAEVTAENLHDEVSFGGPRGRESW
jgi:antitoxin MazE